MVVGGLLQAKSGLRFSILILICVHIHTFYSVPKFMQIPKKISKKMAVLETIWAFFLAVKPIFALS